MAEEDIQGIEAEEEPEEVSNPPMKSPANLVSEISEEDQREIAREICEHYDTDIQSRSVWAEKRNRWFKLWACIRDPKNTPWEGASNVCLPVLAIAANQFQARAYQSIFAAPGMVKTVPIGELDVKRAKNVEKFMNWQTQYEMEEYEEVFDRLLMLLPINGTAFKKISFDPELNRPVSEYIGALDLVLPYATKSMEKARRITHRLWLHYDELEERNDAGLYENFENLNKTPSITHDAELDQTARELDGVESENTEENPHLILECHKRYKLNDEERKPYIFTVDYDTQTLLRVTSRDFEGKELVYFIDYHFIPNPEGFYSLGFGHFLETLTEMGNTAFNQIFDSGSMTNMPFGFYGRRAGFKRRKIKIEPGRMYEVEDATQINFPTIQRVDDVLFNVLGVIKNYTEMFTSTSEYLTGKENQGTKTPTAHGTLAIIEQGLVTFAVMTKRIFRSLRKELRLLMAFNQLFLTDSKQYRVMESEEDIAFPSIKRKDFDSIVDVIPIGDPSYASKTTRTREAERMYQLLMPNPIIQQNMNAVWELTNNLIEAYDVKNKRKILPDLPDAPMSPETENAMFMQGDTTDPKPGENHMGHIKSHKAFLKSPFAKEMEPDYRVLIKKHMLKTMQMIYLEMMQKQAFSGMGGGKNPMAGAPGMPENPGEPYQPKMLGENDDGSGLGTV